jgi:hypothetical protein
MGGKFVDLTGQKFGKLTVLGRDMVTPLKTQPANPKWKCLCDCGKVVLRSAAITKCKASSCGCGFSGEKPYLVRDLSGIRFGSLVAKHFRMENNKTKWFCVCDCGSSKWVAMTALVHCGGKTKTRSCGCLARNLASKRLLVKWEKTGLCGKTKCASDEIRKARGREQYRRSVVELEDSYVKECLLQKQSVLNRSQITNPLIEAKREQLRLHRLMVEFKQALDQRKETT